jgi:catechol 2,3-dioxygenase-like lactoylglutathione lyase family enzyme
MSLTLNHIALWSRSEKNARNFYQELLGFDFLYKFHATHAVMDEIFSIKRPMNVFVFGNDNLKLEIFINDRLQYEHHPVNHICLNVDDVSAVFESAKALNLPRKMVKREGRNLYFIKDFDGNLFELKNIKG